MSKCLWHLCNEEATTQRNKFCCDKCKNKYYVDRRRKAIKKKAIEYLGGKCSICDYAKYQGALQFHHTDPTQKEFNISKSGHSRSWARVAQELDKCILVCANCHAELHADYQEE